MLRIALVAALATAAALFPSAGSPAPREDRAHAPTTSEASCGDCHATIQAEWEGSLHARAYTHPAYQKALSKRRPAQRAACLPCHVPQPLDASGLEPDEDGLPPEAETRTEQSQGFHLGVSCETCHLAADGAMLGPFGGPSSAHTSRKDPRFDPEQVDRICLACHATEIGPVLPLGEDFLASPARERGETCTGCHLAPVERVMATDPELGTPPPERKGRSHGLRGARDPELLATALEFVPRRTPSGVIEVEVRNSGSGHRTPGLVDRSWSLQLQLERPDGEALPRALRSAARTTLEIPHARPLHAGQGRTLRFETAGLEGPVVLRVLRSYALGGREKVTLEELRIPIAD